MHSTNTFSSPTSLAFCSPSPERTDFSNCLHSAMLCSFIFDYVLSSSFCILCSRLTRIFEYFMESIDLIRSLTIFLWLQLPCLSSATPFDSDLYIWSMSIRRVFFYLRSLSVNPRWCCWCCCFITSVNVVSWACIIYPSPLDIGIFSPLQ